MFVQGTYHDERVFASVVFWWFLAVKIPLAVLFTWVYQSTGRLVATAIAFHALGNIIGELFPTYGGARWVSLAILACLAAGVAMGWQRRGSEIVTTVR